MNILVLHIFSRIGRKTKLLYFSGSSGYFPDLNLLCTESATEVGPGLLRRVSTERCLLFLHISSTHACMYLIALRWLFLMF